MSYPNRESAFDKTDLDILLHIQENARKPYREIAKGLGISIGTVSNRINKLIDEGILNIIGEVNPLRVGFEATATIFLTINPPHVLEAAREIALFREVRWLAMATGDADLLADVTCRDMDHLVEFITTKLQLVTGVRDIRTSIIMQLFKTTQPDLSLLLENPSPNEMASASTEQA